MASNFLARIDQLNDADRKHYLKVRTIMRKAHLIAVQATVGLEYYSYEDDSFMDAVDMKVEMLMKRAGLATDENQNSIPSPNQFDPFAHITRPSNIAKLEQEFADVIEPKPKLNDGWGK